MDILQAAKRMDEQDDMRHLRDEFIFPSRGDIRRKKIRKSDDDMSSTDDDKPCTYLCGNSLGLQPKRVARYIKTYLDVWATKGVFGHFKPLDDQLTSPWVDIGEDPRKPLSKLIGSKESEVVVMASLTANLHFLMASFYRPTKERYQIILERKAFPSDHYVVESQILHHNLSVTDSMIFLDSTDDTSLILETPNILATIDAHASTTAVLLLPGLQFYSGQVFDIQRITLYAQSKGIVVGWDLAHAIGNIPLYLHDWNVDFAAWCHYKYMNAGPGAIAGLFVHDRHASVTDPNSSSYVHRLSGWWGSDLSHRFKMDNQFRPINGAGGWQLSNPSAIDTTALIASLSVFEMTTIEQLRARSIELTGYLENLLVKLQQEQGSDRVFRIITPKDKMWRGAQLSVYLQDGLLDPILGYLEDHAVVVDERKPNVIRVAPTPLYNTCEDCVRFVEVFKAACEAATGKRP